MFLSILKEEQKGIFLELAYAMAFLDNDFSEKEQVMIEGYCKEMQVEVPSVIRTRTINEIIASMEAGWENIEKKIVVFEIIGLALVDGNYDEAEREMIKEIVRTLQIENSFVVESEKLLNKYVEIQNAINMLILT